MLWLFKASVASIWCYKCKVHCPTNASVASISFIACNVNVKPLCASATQLTLGSINNLNLDMLRFFLPNPPSPCRNRRAKMCNLESPHPPLWGTCIWPMFKNLMIWLFKASVASIWCNKCKVHCPTNASAASIWFIECNVNVKPLCYSVGAWANE